MCAARLAEEKEGKYSEVGYKRLIKGCKCPKRG
jgi:hypothetical protein